MANWANYLLQLLFAAVSSYSSDMLLPTNRNLTGGLCLHMASLRPGGLWESAKHRVFVNEVAETERKSRKPAEGVFHNLMTEQFLLVVRNWCVELPSLVPLISYLFCIEILENKQVLITANLTFIAGASL